MKNYRKKKESGSLQIFKVKGKNGFVYLKDDFDRNTGEKIGEKAIFITRETYEGRLARLEEEKKDILALLADLDSLQEIKMNDFTGKPKL